MRTRQGSLGRLWAWAGGMIFAAHAMAQPAPDMELPSCVPDSPPLTVPAGAARAALDSADRSRFHDAAQAHHPIYRHGGWVPSQVLLVQRDGQWLYVTTLPRETTGSCFTAVFAAESFEFTKRWLAKYRPRAGAGDF